MNGNVCVNYCKSASEARSNFGSESVFADREGVLRVSNSCPLISACRKDGMGEHGFKKG